MDEQEAAHVLGLSGSVDLDGARARYRRLVRAHHPDVAGAGEHAHARTALIAEAYEIIVASLDARPGGRLLVAEPPPPPPPPTPPSVPTSRAQAVEPVAAEALDEGTIAVDAPGPEAFAALYEAAGRIGDISYVDRQLGILETIVRFEGGPSCSVVMTLQGRAHFTEVFCTMESIEAATAPPIRPVIEALVSELQAP